MRKPRVITNCVANRYTGDWERIVEFSFNKHGPDGGPVGGLIMFREGRGPDPCEVQLYRVDKCIKVPVSKE